MKYLLRSEERSPLAAPDTEVRRVHADPVVSLPGTGGDAYADLAILAVEDIVPVIGAVHPGAHYAVGLTVSAATVGDVLTDHVEAVSLRGVAEPLDAPFCGFVATLGVVS